MLGAPTGSFAQGQRPRHMAALVNRSPERLRWHRQCRSWWSLVLACGLALGRAMPSVANDDTGANEYALKTAFVYNLAKFTEWPERTFMDESSPVTLCVVGENRFADTATAVTGKTVHGRALELRQLSVEQDATRCHILFVAQDTAAPTRDVLASVRNRSVLAIGESDSFLREGGVINLAVSGNNVKFTVNVSAMQRSGLKISSKLLRLAEIYQEPE